MTGTRTTSPTLRCVSWPAVEADVQRQERADAEALAAEWAAVPEHDAAVAYMSGLVDLVRGRVRQARGAAELNGALRDALTGVWVCASDRGIRADIRLHDGGHSRADIDDVGHLAVMTAYCKFARSAGMFSEHGETLALSELGKATRCARGGRYRPTDLGVRAAAGDLADLDIAEACDPEGEVLAL